MTTLFDNVEVLGLLVQAMGAALIGLLCFMLNGVVHRPALSDWWIGWLSLACGLTALLIEQAMPATAAATLPLYMFGEYVFGYWIVSGCAHFAGRAWPRRLFPKAVPVFALIAAAAPQLVGYEFRVIFMMQSLALAITFGAAFVALAPAARRAGSSPGLTAMRVALILLVITFLYYIPIFGANVLRDEPLPLTLLRVSSAVHLLCEFLLGFGGAVLVLEESHHGLAVRYDDLAVSSAKYRDAAERDALTGALNRHAFFSMLSTLSDAGTVVHGCAAMIDVDELKQLNDRLGHSAGDAALTRVVKSVARRARREDQLFRWGGDEFLLVALGVDATDLIERLDLVNRELAMPDPMSVQVSYGAVGFGNVGELLEAVKRADTDMYALKRERAALKRRMDSGGVASVEPKRPAHRGDPSTDPGSRA
ncbi:MAG TPA: GGDEF domain-containing protein [Rudaea sp.]|nr:GGDEF domain-containing protein [Rudaea sp.]